jgi:hypothetical protein
MRRPTGTRRGVDAHRTVVHDVYTYEPAPSPYYGPHYGPAYALPGMAGEVTVARANAAAIGDRRSMFRSLFPSGSFLPGKHLVFVAR